MNNNMNQSPIKSVNPFTNKVEKVFDVMSPQKIEQKISNAEKAYKVWKNTPFAERAKILHKVASIFRDKKEDMAKLCTIEMGKLMREGVTEVLLCADIIDYYADNAEKLLANKILERPKGRGFIIYEPLGVILSIQPWNFPYSQLIRNAAPIVASGNTIVVKHASNVPQCAGMVEQIFKEAGIPDGVYTNLYVPGSQASQIAADPRIQGVTLTGSKPAGSSLATIAGKYVKRSVLELGGSDPSIILDDADLDKAANVVGMGRLKNAGQVCTSPKRVIVLNSVADQFIAKVKAIYENIKIGDPMDATTTLGPMSSEKQLQSVLKQVEEAVNSGAKLVHGGKRLAGDASFMEPTILVDIKPNTPIYSEEIFGPVLCIFRVKDENEAIQLANNCEFGLGGSVFSTNEDRAIKVASQVETGMVGINGLVSSTPELPFGGVKQSGYGRELSPMGIYEFVNPKLIRID